MYIMFMNCCRIIEKLCGTVQFLIFLNFSKTGSSFRKMYCLHVHDYNDDILGQNKISKINVKKNVRPKLLSEKEDISACVY